MTTGDDVKRDVNKAVHSEDQPMGKRSPSTPFAMVGLGYMIVLALALVAIAVAIWLFS